MDKDSFVQVIAVPKNRGTHEEVVVAVALASVLAWLNDLDNPNWKKWFSGRFTKSVRRGTPSQVGAVKEEAKAIVPVGGVEALGFAPVLYSEMKPPLTKMQVANFERDRESTTYRVNSLGPTLYVNEGLGMSTGKTAAQAAHALMGWALNQSVSEIEGWVLRGFQFSLFGVDSREFESKKILADLVIEDAGFTEVDPHSATVLVVG